MRTPASFIAVACAVAVAPAISHAAPPQAGTRYLHADHRGDVALASDRAAAVLGRFRNRPWGGKGAHTSELAGTPRVFDDWKRDAATGLMHAGARYYAARLGRFLSADPAQQSVYAALGAAPLEHIDPDGRRWYRLHLDSGLPAFRINAARTAYERIPGVTPRVVNGPPKYITDVFFHEPAYEPYKNWKWDPSIFNGWTRGRIGNLEARRLVVSTWVERQGLSRAERIRSRRRIHLWARRVGLDYIAPQARTGSPPARAPVSPAATRIDHVPIVPIGSHQERSTRPRLGAEPANTTVMTWKGPAANSSFPFRISDLSGPSNTTATTRTRSISPQREAPLPVDSPPASDSETLSTSPSTDSCCPDEEAH